MRIVAICALFGWSVAAHAGWKVGIIGSSTFAGTGANTYANSVVGLLENYLTNANPAIRVANFSQGGWTTFNVLTNANGLPLALTTNDVIIVAPNNDLSSGYSLQTITNNYLDIQGACAGKRLGVVTIFPRDGIPCNQNDPVLLFQTNYFGTASMNVWTSLAVSAVNCNQNPTYAFGDGIHFNEAGHHKMFQDMTNSPFIRALLASYFVTDYGAIGDCQEFYVQTSASSATAVTTNSLGSSAVGKVMQIFGAGAPGAYAFSSANPETSTTNNQDLCVTISGVSGFNVTLSTAASVTGTFRCLFGTNNAPVFQSVVNLATNGDTIVIPAGNYMLLSASNLNPTSQMLNYAASPAALFVTKGGLTFQGAGTNLTRITGAGAWQNRTNVQHLTLLPSQDVMSGMRGTLITHMGPISNDYSPTIYEGIAFDGGVAVGQTDFDYFPVLVSNGDGWDVTHGAILDGGTAPYLDEVIIRNCAFVHWRGEILKGVVSGVDSYRTITNCLFFDGNASANNFSMGHRIDGCVFDTLKLAQEYYVGQVSQPSYFINSRITNISGVTGGGIGIVLTGAEVGGSHPKYTISNNVIAAQSSAIFLVPFQNLDILTNVFFDSVTGVFFGSAGAQGTTNTWGVNVFGNRMTNVFNGIVVAGAPGATEVNQVQVYGNIQKYPGGSSTFATGYGWGTNVILQGNTTDGVLFGVYGDLLLGQYYKDVDNNFPVHASNDATGVTNALSYMRGRKHGIMSQVSGSRYVADATNPQKIPRGATMLWTNGTASTATVLSPLFDLPSASTQMLYWSGSQWLTNAGTVLYLGNLRL